MNLSGRTLLLRYSAFAIMAMALNVSAQMVSFSIYTGPAALWFAIMVGTMVGLATKYLLDKHWIFYDSTVELAAYSRKFTLYTLTGIPTTAIFWVTEWTFEHIGGTAEWRYAGALLGLAIGYVIKYRLDRRFVFLRTVK